MPSDCGGIKDHVGSLQRRNASAFRIPLIPADQRAYFSVAGIESTKAEISGREIKLFVVERIVRDVHLAVHAAQRAIRVKDDRRVVVDARSALLEQGSDQH